MKSKGSATDETSVLKTISYHSTASEGASLPTNINIQTVVVSIVNPQGTVTTVTTNDPIQLDESFSSDSYIHANCDETMFRPVVTVISDPRQRQLYDSLSDENVSQPIEMSSQLIVPVIDENMLEQKKKEREMEQQEKTRQKRELELARIVLEKEAEEKRKLENEKAQKKLEEKAEEVPSGATRKGKKAQKYNKKYSELEKKPVDKKVKESSPPKSSPPPPPVDESLTDESDKNLTQIDLKEEIDEAPVEEPPQVEPLKVKSFMAMMKAAKASSTYEKEKSPDSFKPLSSGTISVPETAPEIGEVKTLLSKPLKISEITSSKREKSPSPAAVSDVNEDVMESEPQSADFVQMKQEAKSSILAASKAVDESTDIPEAMKTKPKPSEKVEVVKPPEPAPRRGKRGKKYPPKEKASPKVEDDFPPLGSPPPLVPPPIDDHRAADSEAIMKISMHETIGDDEIEIIPHENKVEISDSPEKSEKSNSDGELIDDHFLLPEEPIEAKKKQTFIKNEDFYDIDDELPPLAPLGSFDINFGSLSFDERQGEEEKQAEEEEPAIEEDEQKPDMQTKMSELLKDTNMIFAMCSSLKEMKDDDDAKSMGSSQIQRSASSSLTTNTTTATFASASSNQTGEGQDSDYRSLELEMEENAADRKIEVQIEVKQIDDCEDVSSFDATSSETDDSSKKSNTKTPQFKREDDEELRPLLQTSITSLSSPSAAPPTNTTEANDASTLPDTNQKASSSSSLQANSNNGNGNKRKNKKKRR